MDYNELRTQIAHTIRDVRKGILTKEKKSTKQRKPAADADAAASSSATGNNNSKRKQQQQPQPQHQLIVSSQVGDDKENSEGNHISPAVAATMELEPRELKRFKNE